MERAPKQPTNQHLKLSERFTKKLGRKTTCYNVTEIFLRMANINEFKMSGDTDAIGLLKTLRMNNNNNNNNIMSQDFFLGGIFI